MVKAESLKCGFEEGYGLRVSNLSLWFYQRLFKFGQAVSPE